MSFRQRRVRDLRDLSDRPRRGANCCGPALSSRNFVASGTWSLKRPWRLDYGRSVESPWHTFTDSFGAKTTIGIACVP